MATIEERVNQTVADQLDVKLERVTPQAKLEDDLYADSLDLVMLALALEDEFEIEIPDEDGVKFKTVGDITTYVNDAVVK